MTDTESGSEQTAAPEAPNVPAQQPAVDLVKPEPTPAAAHPATTGEAGGDGQRITFQSMADRLTLGLMASVIGAVLVFISAFLTWSSVHATAVVGNRRTSVVVDSLGVSGNRLGTETLILSIAALVLIGIMLLPATKPWAWQVLLGMGLLIALLAFIDMVSLPSHPRPDAGICSGVTCHFSQTIGPGMWFTLVAGLLIAVGAYVHHIRPVPFRPATSAASDAATTHPQPEPAVAEPPVATPVAETAVAETAVAEDVPEPEAPQATDQQPSPPSDKDQSGTVA